MSEVGNGIYKYDFSAYDEDEEYSFVADGGSALEWFIRYKYGGSAEADIKLIKDDLVTVQADLDDPDQYKADVSGLAPAGEYDSELTAIQADLDNPDQYKADVSALATEANATANRIAIIAEIDANEVKIDAMQLDITAIKAIIDNLPADTENELDIIKGLLLHRYKYTVLTRDCGKPLTATIELFEDDLLTIPLLTIDLTTTYTAEGAVSTHIGVPQ